MESDGNDNDRRLVPRGKPFYMEIPCRIEGNKLIVPAFTIPSWSSDYDDHPYRIPPVNDEGYTLTEEEARADSEEDDDDN